VESFHRPKAPWRPDRLKMATDARALLASGVVSRDNAREGLSLIVKELRAKFVFPENEPCPLIQLIRELDRQS
jgi:hypothetical protein